MTKKQRERLAVYNKYNGHCGYCGTAIAYKEMQIDHVEPIGAYGYDEKGKRLSRKRFIAAHGQERYDRIHSFDNLMPVCRYCNHHKRQWSLEMYRYLVDRIGEKISKDYLVKRGIRYGFVVIKEWDGKFYFEKIEENKQKGE